MPRRKWNLNSVYISERLQEGLRPISYCALTTVIAPMGYGKTTAVNWFLSEREKEEKVNIVRISVYSGNVTIFWKSVQDAFMYAGYDFLRSYPCPGDAAGGSLLADMFCHELRGEKPCYVFIDDFHLMTEHRVADFVCYLVNRLPENVHLIIAGRDRFLPAAEILRLGNNVYQIGVENLRLNHTELSVYAHRCGFTITEEEIESLLYSSEGWFSAVYLNLRTLFERGSLPDRDSDIYAMFTAAMIEPLPDEQREFLAVMGLADEFTIDMAKAVTGRNDSLEMIRLLTEQNAFVTKLADGVSYRFHHMMKECADRAFRMLPVEKQRMYHDRYGEWYEERGQYLHALFEYKKSENFDGLLRVIQKDAGILLSSLDPESVLEDLDKWPKEVMREHPLSVLVLMRCMFNWHKIPKMLELKELLLNSINESLDMNPVERGNLLGECDLITSFLMYNDIVAMSRLHRSASSQMSRTAISLNKSGGWTFGSPSVLMMFHRSPGSLKEELSEMDECMPHYYKITNGHGQGAEKIMRAEAYLMKGRFEDANIEIEGAYPRIEESGQENMALCCDFAARRLSLWIDIEQRYTFEERYEQLLKSRNIAQINIWSAISAYYHALLNEPEKIPEIFREHMLSTVNILAPGKPMYEMIENQVYLIQGAYAKVIGRGEGLMAMCEGLHYGLVLLHVYIQNAAAYEMLGKREEAQTFIKKAIECAVPDELILPFAENYQYIREILNCTETGKEASFVEKIRKLGQKYEKGKERNRENAERPSVFAVLTDREYEIVMIMKNRMTNREIADKLFLSEGSVKQYVNQIYSKLDIEGDKRTKRQQLYKMLDSNT